MDQVKVINYWNKHIYVFLYFKVYMDRRKNLKYSLYMNLSILNKQDTTKDKYMNKFLKIWVYIIIGIHI